MRKGSLVEDLNTDHCVHYNYHTAEIYLHIWRRETQRDREGERERGREREKTDKQ